MGFQGHLLWPVVVVVLVLGIAQAEPDTCESGTCLEDTALTQLRMEKSRAETEWFGGTVVNWAKRHAKRVLSSAGKDVEKDSTRPRNSPILEKS